VIMTVEPAILDKGDKINLKIAPEVSSLDYSNSVTINGRACCPRSASGRPAL